MMNFNESKKIILDAVSSCSTEVISVREALGRVLAKDVKAPQNFPGNRTSAVDGYAIRPGGGLKFNPAGVIAAGELPKFSLEPGQCAAVMTGGIVPDGTECVVMVEECEENNGIIETKVKLEAGALINEPGSETAAGDIFAQQGARINHAVYPALYYAGISHITVYRAPRIGLLTTGSELREVEDGPASGQVFNTNRYILESFLDSIGLNIEFEKNIPDNEKDTLTALRDIAGCCDIIVSSGGVSMGRYDYIKKIFNEKDFSLLIQGTAIKPGRPLMVAEREGGLFFGMPGYPAAFLTNALLYLIPALKKASGRMDYDHNFMNVRLTTPMNSRKGKLYLNRAILELIEGEWTARNPGSQKTSHFLNFTDVNGLVLLPETAGNIKAGARVQALHFDSVLS